ncbi:MAG: response regulator [Deltaproteobacteria bacterium]|nr:response regulator [Deltaproteobacteria bacterium]
MAPRGFFLPPSTQSTRRGPVKRAKAAAEEQACAQEAPKSPHPARNPRRRHPGYPGTRRASAGELKKRILVIDDHEAFLESISAQLRYLRYAVRTTSNSLEGIHLLRREGFDLAIVDMIMPEVGGLIVINVIRQEHPRLPILVTSGYHGKLVDVLKDEQIEGVLPKPIRLKSLMNTLNGIFSGKTRATGHEPYQPRRPDA